MTRRTGAEPDFATEAALCAAFIAWARGRGWVPYAETAGWDVLLVAPDGTQIGVQAKLRLNLKVVAQALDDHWAHLQPEGPDFRAVLVPWSTAVSEGAGTICAALGLQVIAQRGRDPDLDFCTRWHYWAPERRIVLPDYVPDVVAGSPAPVQLTKWKVAALRLFARLQIRGYLTRADFRAEHVDARRWLLPRSWLKPGPEPGTFVANDAPGAAVPVSAQHPEVFPKIVEQERRKLAHEPGTG